MGVIEYKVRENEKKFKKGNGILLWKKRLLKLLSKYEKEREETP